MMRESLQPYADRMRRMSREIIVAIALTLAAAIALIYALRTDGRETASVVDSTGPAQERAN